MTYDEITKQVNLWLNSVMERKLIPEAHFAQTRNKVTDENINFDIYIYDINYVIKMRINFDIDIRNGQISDAQIW